MRTMLDRLHLNTICQNAGCPNLGECWAARTATFLILGHICTRNCGFCKVTSGRPVPPDPKEPEQVAEAVRELGLKHAVITSVSRDDLPDGGAGQFAATIRAVKRHCPGCTVEVLIPDFGGRKEDLAVVLAEAPDVLAHNLETVARLHARIRPGYNYRRSLELLRRAKEMAPQVFTKSSLMVGLGESEEDLVGAFADLRQVDCDFLTIGQYLPPTRQHVPVSEYVTPEKFALYKERALAAGFRFVASGPLVRSSYKAGEALQTMVGGIWHGI